MDNARFDYLLTYPHPSVQGIKIFSFKTIN